MKTIKEAAHEYFRRAQLHLAPAGSEYGFVAGVEFAQRWIHVEEELPPLCVPVICKYGMFGKECHWTGTFYSEERRMHFINKHLKITHWRPINLK